MPKVASALTTGNPAAGRYLAREADRVDIFSQFDLREKTIQLVGVHAGDAATHEVSHRLD